MIKYIIEIKDNPDEHIVICEQQDALSLGLYDSRYYTEFYMPGSKYHAYKINLMYLLGGELTLRRYSYIENSAYVISYMGLTNIIETYNSLSKMEFEIDISVLINAFSCAYGNDWITEYFKQHGQELQKLY